MSMIHVWNEIQMATSRPSRIILVMQSDLHKLPLIIPPCLKRTHARYLVADMLNNFTIKMATSRLSLIMKSLLMHVQDEVLVKFDNYWKFLQINLHYKYDPRWLTGVRLYFIPDMYHGHAWRNLYIETST